MKSVHEILRQKLLRQAGVEVTDKPWWCEYIPDKVFVTLAEIEAAVKKKWCKKFFKLMRTRLEMGYLRYEVGNQGANKKKYDYIKAMRDKIDLYEKTGNTEFMVDVGNYAMLEFSQGNHPNRHYYGSDDVGHAEVIK